MKPLSRLLFAVALLAWLAFLFLTGEHLPERMASHFDASGKADGWMLKAHYQRSIALYSLMLPGSVLALAWVFRFFPNGMINLPNSGYWFQPQNRPRLDALVLNWGFWMSSACLGFFAGIHTLVIYSNRLQPPRLDNAMLMLLVVVYLLAIATCILLLIRRLLVPATT